MQTLIISEQVLPVYAYLKGWSIGWCDQLLGESGKLMWLHIRRCMLVGITLPMIQNLYASVRDACLSC